MEWSFPLKRITSARFFSGAMFSLKLGELIKFQIIFASAAALSSERSEYRLKNEFLFCFASSQRFIKRETYQSSISCSSAWRKIHRSRKSFIAGFYIPIAVGSLWRRLSPSMISMSGFSMILFSSVTSYVVWE